MQMCVLKHAHTRVHINVLGEKVQKKVGEGACEDVCTCDVIQSEKNKTKLGAKVQMVQRY